MSSGCYQGLVLGSLLQPSPFASIEPSWLLRVGCRQQRQPQLFASNRLVSSKLAMLMLLTLCGSCQPISHCTTTIASQLLLQPNCTICVEPNPNSACHLCYFLQLIFFKVG